MRASDSATLVLLAIAVTGCGPVFGVETPAWVSSTPASHLYEGAAPSPVATGIYDGAAPAYTPPPTTRPHQIELHAPVTLVVRTPPGMGPDTYINVSCVAAPLPAAESRYRPSPYGDEEDDPVPIRPPYKPSPYEDARPPRLYRDD